jgi:hypothetical protein
MFQNTDDFLPLKDKSDAGMLCASTTTFRRCARWHEPDSLPQKVEAAFFDKRLWRCK